MLLNCIEQVRKQQGLSLRELARRAALSPATLSRIEKGQQTVSDQQYLAIARALAVEVQALLLNKPRRSRKPRPRQRGASS